MSGREPPEGQEPDGQRLRGRNFYLDDAQLSALLARRTGAALARWAPELEGFGAFVGGPVDAAAAYTDRHARPTLVGYDAAGERVDRVLYNPAWREVLDGTLRHGFVGLNYGAAPAPYWVTFAMAYLLGQADISLSCPMGMSTAVAYVLDRFAPEPVKAAWLPPLVARDGTALTAGTWATERHGGADVGATTTTARPAGNHVVLNGLKWFVSNVDGGVALATARPDPAVDGSRGLGLYLVPWKLPEGGRNPLQIRRLKDKLGTCGIATAEVQLTDTWAVEVAPPPQGFRLMMEALEFSRLQNAMGALGVQRRAWAEAAAYCRRRSAFGAPVTRYAMVQDELIRILAPLEAGLELGFEAVLAFERTLGQDLAQDRSPERAWLRLVTALAKYQTAEHANVACRTAIEAMGGNAYTNDYCLPRLMRDALALAIWEGPANVQALEVMRLLGPRYGAFALFEQRVSGIVAQAAAGLEAPAAAVATALDDCRRALGVIGDDKAAAARAARRLMALLADTLAAALLLEAAGAAAGEQRTRKAALTDAYLGQSFGASPMNGIGAPPAVDDELFAALLAAEPA